MATQRLLNINKCKNDDNDDRCIIVIIIINEKMFWLPQANKIHASGKKIKQKMAQLHRKLLFSSL